MAWTWTYADVDGSDMAGDELTTAEFPTQAEAETWFGESWQDLADAGVDAVTLWSDGVLVYGPMSLQTG